MFTSDSSKIVSYFDIGEEDKENLSTELCDDHLTMYPAKSLPVRKGPLKRAFEYRTLIEYG